MNEKYAIGVDVGGSHIACQVMELNSCSPVAETYTEVKIAESESAQKILSAWDNALSECMQKAGARAITGMGVAIPSPFDFIRGIAQAEHKFASIKGINVRSELHRITGIDPNNIRFTNDAAGFGMGAWSLGGGKARHLIGVTLGTGFGASFIVDGCYATYGPGVPIGGELWDYPFRGRIAEDFVSTRWFEEEFHQITGVPITGVKPMIDFYHADKYTTEVRAIFDQFANTFAEIMLPFVQHFKADTLVIGGGMVRAEEFFFPQIRNYFSERNVQIPIVAMADTTSAIIAGAAALCQ